MSQPICKLSRTCNKAGFIFNNDSIYHVTFTLTHSLSGCADGSLHWVVCLAENNFKEPNLETPEAEACSMRRMSLMCMDRAVTAYPACNRADEARSAIERARPEIEVDCSAIGNSAPATTVAGVFVMLFMTCVHYLR